MVVKYYIIKQCSRKVLNTTVEKYISKGKKSQCVSGQKCALEMPQNTTILNMSLQIGSYVRKITSSEVIQQNTTRANAQCQKLKLKIID